MCATSTYLPSICRLTGVNLRRCVLIELPLATCFYPGARHGRPAGRCATMKRRPAPVPAQGRTRPTRRLFFHHGLLRGDRSRRLQQRRLAAHCTHKHDRASSGVWGWRDAAPNQAWKNGQLLADPFQVEMVSLAGGTINKKRPTAGAAIRRPRDIVIRLVSQTDQSGELTNYADPHRQTRRQLACIISIDEGGRQASSCGADHRVAIEMQELGSCDQLAEAQRLLLKRIAPGQACSAQTATRHAGLSGGYGSTRMPSKIQAFRCQFAA